MSYFNFRHPWAWAWAFLLIWCGGLVWSSLRYSSFDGFDGGWIWEGRGRHWFITLDRLALGYAFSITSRSHEQFPLPYVQGTACNITSDEVTECKHGFWCFCHAERPSFRNLFSFLSCMCALRRVLCCIQLVFYFFGLLPVMG